MDDTGCEGERDTGWVSDTERSIEGTFKKVTGQKQTLRNISQSTWNKKKFATLLRSPELFPEAFSGVLSYAFQEVFPICQVF